MNEPQSGGQPFTAENAELQMRVSALEAQLGETGNFDLALEARIRELTTATGPGLTRECAIEIIKRKPGVRASPAAENAALRAHVAQLEARLVDAAQYPPEIAARLRELMGTGCTREQALEIIRREPKYAALQERFKQRG